MSAKRKRAVAKNGPIWHLSAEEATLAQMPHFNAHACGTGAHGDAKYNRARQKRAWQREIDREGACNRRPLRFAERTSSGSGLRNSLDAFFFFFKRKSEAPEPKAR